jgi:hypothetical protein
MKTFFLFFFIFITASCINNSSCMIKKMDIEVIPENQKLKNEIPVDIENKYYASSSESNFLPINVFDFNENTFWSPSNNGLNEWLAVYIGSVENLGKITDCNMVIWDGYRISEEVNKDYFKLTSYRIEFYIDDDLILERTISKSKYSEENGFPGYIESDFQIHNSNYEKGTFWVKVIILEAEKKGSVAIRDIKFSFKNTNPFNAIYDLSFFCDAINRQDIEAISNFTEESPGEVLNQFTSEFVPEDGPGCNIESLEVHSDEIVSLFMVEGGDGGSRAFFRYLNGKWKLYKYAYFSYF